MKTQYKIYVLKDPRTQEIRYVGVTCQSLHQRLSNHLYYAKKRNCTHVHNWIFTLIEENLKPIIEVIENVTKSNWESKEKYWIKYYKDKCNLTNIAEGGKGLIKSRTVTSRQRSAIAHEKRILQLSLSGEIIKEFVSIKQANKETGLSRTNIGNALTKRNNSAGGYQWLYEKEYSDKDIYIIKDKQYGYKPVIRTNIKTMKITNYKNLIEAYTINNLSRSILLRLIKTKKIICEYQFSFDR